MARRKKTDTEATPAPVATEDRVTPEAIPLTTELICLINGDVAGARTALDGAGLVTVEDLLDRANMHHRCGIITALGDVDGLDESAVHDIADRLVAAGLIEESGPDAANGTTFADRQALADRLTGDTPKAAAAPETAPEPVVPTQVPYTGIPKILMDKFTELQKLKANTEYLKNLHGAAKKKQDAGQAEFDNLFLEATREMPLFDGQGKNGSAAPAPASEDAWRAVTLVDAIGAEEGITPKMLEKLREAELETVGQLADYTAADQGRLKLTDITGIGPAAAEKIEKGMEGFWKRWYEEHPQTATEDRTMPCGHTPENCNCEPSKEDEEAAEAEARADDEAVDQEGEADG